MTLPPRQHDILELARERGYVSIDELAQAFAVTPQTIRRDINQLAEQGLLRRTHGGAASESSSTQNTAYSMRAGQMRDEKQRIAAAIAAQIPNHASLSKNIGTTTEAIARELLGHKGLKIITNNLHVAAQLTVPPASSTSKSALALSWAATCRLLVMIFRPLWPSSSRAMASEIGRAHV